MTSKMLLAAFTAGAVTSAATAELVGVVGGQTNILLDFATIQSATGLEFAGVSDGVITPGNLGPNSVAFAITSPAAQPWPTTFTYDSSDFLGTYGGELEHRGSISFTGSADLTLGNFTIDRVGRSGGLEVTTNLGIPDLPLFDVLITETNALESTLGIMGELLISNTFAGKLIELGLTSTDLTGVDVGDAFIQGFNQPIPAPGALAVLACTGLVARRRR